VYAASKAEAWSATNALRGELAPQGTGVTVSYDGVARGDFKVLADDESRRVKALLSGRSEDLNAFVTEWLAGAAS
jgi:short-subunit dehydrogenase